MIAVENIVGHVVSESSEEGELLVHEELLRIRRVVDDRCVNLGIDGELCDYIMDDVCLARAFSDALVVDAVASLRKCRADDLSVDRAVVRLDHRCIIEHLVCDCELLDDPSLVVRD